MRPAAIEIDHRPGRGWFRAGDEVTLRISGPYEGPETVTCVIPGHKREGREELKVGASPLEFEFRGNCAYESTFDYAG